MENSIWVIQANERIEKIIQSMDLKKDKKLRVPLLKRIIARVDEFSIVNCTQCEENKKEVDKLLEMLEKSSSNINIKEYNDTFKKVLVHLEKEHKLVQEGTYMATYMSIGIAIGMGLGVSFGVSSSDKLPIYMSLGMCFGTAIGLTIGTSMDQKAKKEGKVI